MIGFLSCYRLALHVFVGIEGQATPTTLRKLIEAEGGEPVAWPTLFAVLRRLHERGLIEIREDRGTSPRFKRSRKLYRLVRS
jgi:DNA-binding PadR family transcriptional regulator